MHIRAITSNRGLLGVNLALLIALAVVSILPEPDASVAAQPAGRGRGDYTLVSGRSQGSTASTIYILDAVNQELIAVRWNDSRRMLEGLDYRDLGGDTAGNSGQTR
jgi:hypothetical protein